MTGARDATAADLPATSGTVPEASGAQSFTNDLINGRVAGSVTYSGDLGGVGAVTINGTPTGNPTGSELDGSIKINADFAAETANLSRAQILQQAGNAMIAQANQLPQQVLQLLR